MPAARFCFPHHGNRTLDLFLYDEVVNAGDLRARLSSGEDVGCAILGASTLAGTSHILLAANKALARDRDGTRKVKGLHVDLIFALAGSKNIGEALRRFGIPDDDAGPSEDGDPHTDNQSCRICVAVFDAGGQTPAMVRELVRGREACDPLRLMEVGSWSDRDALRKLFRVSSLEEGISPTGLFDAIINRMGTSEA